MRKLHFAYGSFAALLAIGCSDGATGPPAPTRPERHVAATGVALVSSAVKYRDAGHRPVTGRDGGAVVSMRALLGRDGLTTVDIHAGEPGGAATGMLRKVQLKTFATDGALRATRNEAGLQVTGTTIALGGLERGAPIQLQANVQVAGSTRTGVVTVRDGVRLRPDLAVGPVSAPATALAGLPTTIVAVVRELNGDVGAWTTCVLDVDGVPAASVSGIWVDAGGTVSCRFTQTFATAGDHALAVRFAGSDPSDDDPSSDVATASITIVDEVRLAFQAQAMDDSIRHSRVGNEQFYGDVTMQGPHYLESRQWSYSSAGRQQLARLDASTSEQLAFPENALRDLRFSMGTGGANVVDVRLDSLSADRVYVDGEATVACASRSLLGEVVASLEICTRSAPSGDQLATTVTFMWSAGDVTYESMESGSVACIPPTTCTPSSYYWNTTSRQATGTAVRFGPEFSIDAEFMSGGRRALANALMPMQASYMLHTIPTACRDWRDIRAGHVGRAYTCEGESYEYWYHRGAATGAPSTALANGG